MKLLYRLLLVLSTVRLFWLNWRLNRLGRQYKNCSPLRGDVVGVGVREQWLGKRAGILTSRFNRVMVRRAELRTKIGQ